MLTQTYRFIVENQEQFWSYLGQHLLLSITALVIAILICVPLGVISAKKEWIAKYIVSSINTLRVIPSLAILVLLLPILGTGFLPALIALTVLACPPILINTFQGILSVSENQIEAAKAMGMTELQMIQKVELPQALPSILTGIRVAAVEVIASASLAAFIGGGGLGVFVIQGMGLYEMPTMLAGAIPIACLALLSEGIFTLLLFINQRRVKL
ncbi:MAG: ABC transporter permease [Enterococcus sp.]